MKRPKTRAMSLVLHDAKLETTHADGGLRRWLVMEDFHQGRCIRRVRVPLYGSNVRIISRVLRDWRDALLEEAKAVNE